MIKFLTLLSLSHENMAAAISAGGERDPEAAVRAGMEAFGGTLVSMYAVDSGGYDMVSISQFPDQVTARACMAMFKATGVTTRADGYVISSVEDHRKAMGMAKEKMGAYTPPAKR